VPLLRSLTLSLLLLGSPAFAERALAPPPPADAGDPIGVIVSADGSPAYRSEGGLTAWSGSAWTSVLQSECPKGRRCYARVTAGETCLRLAAEARPLASKVDVDGDGRDDVLVALECTSSDDDICGTLVLVGDATCLKATGFVSGEKVRVHKAGRPAELLVSTESEDSPTWAETVMVHRGGGWRPTLTRDCRRGKGCGKTYPERKRKGDGLPP
jgi:hypothetical protein